MPQPDAAIQWARRRRRVSTALVAAGPAVMIVGIVAIATVIPERLFIVFLFVGTGLLTGGLIVRYLADPVFAPHRSLDGESED